MQRSLFDESPLTGQFAPGKPDPLPLAKSRGPETSKAAAAEFCQNGTLSEHEERVVWLSDTCGGPWTAHELAAWSKEKHSVVNQLTDVQITRRVAGLLRKDVLEFVDESRCSCCRRRMQRYQSKRKSK